MDDPSRPRAVSLTDAEIALRSEILQVFVGPHDEEAMYAAVLALVLEAFHSEHGLFGHIDEAGALVVPSPPRGPGSGPETEGHCMVFPRQSWGGLWGQALVERRPLYSNGPLTVPLGHIAIDNALCVPVVFRDALIGLIVVGNSAEPYDDADRRMLVGLAEFMAPVLGVRIERDRSRGEQARVREALERRTLELRERVKELDCLYNIARLIERNLLWQEVAQRSLLMLPPAFQHPALAVARIEVGDDAWQTPGYRETSRGLTSVILLSGEAIGRIDVCYLDAPGAPEPPPFLIEEHKLLAAVAERLGRVIERQRTAEERDAQGRKVNLMEALRSTLAIILAGGRGNRLHPLTADVAKPAVAFGGKFRLIDFPLSNCINSGIRRVAVVTQYKAHQLLLHLRSGWGFLRAEQNEFVELWPAQQQTEAGTWYLGTADAIWQNLSILEHHAPEHVLILAGDHIYKQDYSVMLAEHLERGADVSVSCTDVPVEQASGFGVVQVDADDNIVAFEEKPERPTPLPGRESHALVSTGIYMVRSDFLAVELRRDAANPASTHDLARDILPDLIGRCRIVAHHFANSCVSDKGQAYWRDVGTIDAYWEANMDLTHVVPELDIYDPRWPIWTYLAQEPPAKFVYDGDDRRGIAVESLVSSGSIVSGATVRRSLLFRRVRVHSHARVEDSVVLPNADIGEGAVLKRTIVDSGTRIPAGLVVGEDPQADARRFHRTERGVTLVTQAMVDALSP